MLDQLVLARAALSKRLAIQVHEPKLYVLHTYVHIHNFLLGLMLCVQVNSYGHSLTQQKYRLGTASLVKTCYWGGG